MSRFIASGLDKKEQYSCLYSRPNKSGYISIQFMLLAIVISRVQFYQSQHNCDVVIYVSYVNFYVDFVASY